ncbi:conserved protein of unknown function [Nitrospira japonica]|uniref:Rhs family protein n=1 Tax=Nitrospira japonica TaxID=1325564 RepID=A0A1W1I1H8_9BACT|nr:hypothetical protein [Nitrospira japonica]SLM46858.1 conserved protein of unknown function [Nitrospira japonica]
MNVRAAYGWTFMAGVLVASLVLGGAAARQASDRERDGLVGLVHRVVSTTGGTSVTNTYSRDGILLETVTRNAPPADQPDVGERMERVVYEYDAQGRRQRDMIDEGDGYRYLSRVYAYDQDGKVLAEASYSMCGTFSSLTLYTYDDAGRVQEDLSYRLRSLFKRTHEFDSHGRMTLRRNYKNNGAISSTGYRYDEHGRLAEESELRPDGTLERKVSYRYDWQGNQILEETTNLADSSLNGTRASSYEYDAQGNWTARTVQHPVVPRGEETSVEITRRTITYYDHPSK